MCVFWSVFCRNVRVLMTAVSAIISGLFIVMLLCLGGVVHSLLRPGPAHAAGPAHAVGPAHTAGRGEAGLKRRAVCNVMMVVVPAVVIYSPILVSIPLELSFERSPVVVACMCGVWETANIFPMFGVFIGPLFYFSKAKQMCCRDRKVKM